MYRIVSGSTRDLPDVESLVAMLNRLPDHPLAQVRTFFEPNHELTIARAPGRLDVMGGIADYSGSLVLQLPTAEGTLVALQRTPERKIRILSLPLEASGRALDFEMSLAEFEVGNDVISYETARSYFRDHANRDWAAYVAGAFLVLMRERGVAFSQGARILIVSTVPQGKGVSSSAALEVAVMQAVVSAFDIFLAPIELALLCQKVENLVVGAACGVMDQLTATCGEAGRLLRLRCQPATLEQGLPIPDDISFVGIDSGVRHTVGGADYTSVRVGAFMGYRIIADLAGLPVKQSKPKGALTIDDPKWGGYLANITPSEFEQYFAVRLPEMMTGAEFLKKYKGTTDPVTQVEIERSYLVKAATAHPVYENFRVETFAELLSRPLNVARKRLLGELMYQSHASYSACGLGSSETDLLVKLVRDSGSSNGLYGAKITGGGTGGTVAIMCQAGAVDAVREIANQYERQTNCKPDIFNGTSMGAATFDCLRLKLAN